MFRNVARLGLTAVAAVGLALAVALPAGATARPDTISNSTTVTTNNGVAGVNSNVQIAKLTHLRFCLTITPTDNNLTVGADGVGAQLGDGNTGKTAGAGIERDTTPGTFLLKAGYGNLNGDPGAIFSNATHSGLDTNKELGGILPATSIQTFAMDTVVSTGDYVCFTIEKSRAHSGGRRWWLTFTASDESTTADQATIKIRCPHGVQPVFTQVGVGSQKSLTLYTSPINTANQLVNADSIHAGESFYGGFNVFGCHDSTDYVNSSATTNGDAGANPNPQAQMDANDSLAGGCGSSDASVSVYTGDQV